MKKVILLVSIIFAFFSFAFFKDNRGKQQLNEIGSLTEYENNELYSSSFTTFDISDGDMEILIDELYKIVSEYHVGVMYQPSYSYLDHHVFLAGNREIVDNKIPYLSSNTSIVDFLDRNETKFYSTETQDSIYLLSEATLNIYPLNLILDPNVCDNPSFTFYSIYSNEIDELEKAVRHLKSIELPGVIESDVGATMVDFEGKSISQSIVLMILSMVLLFCLLLIENLNQDKHILIRKLHGHHPLRIIMHVNAYLLLISLVTIISSYVILFRLYEIQIVNMSKLFISDLVTVVLLVAIGFFILIFILVLLIEKYTVTRRLEKTWILSEKLVFILLNMAVVSILWTSVRSFESVWSSTTSYYYNNEMLTSYDGYYYVDLSQIPPSYQVENYNEMIDMFESLNHEGVIALPTYRGSLRADSDVETHQAIMSSEPKAIMFDTNYNFINELNLKDINGDSIRAEEGDEVAIVDSSLVSQDITELRIPDENIYFVDNFKITFADPQSFYYLYRYVNNPAHILIYNNRSDIFISSRRYMIKTDELNLNLQLPFEFSVSSVKEYHERQASSYVSEIIVGIQDLVIFTLTILSLCYLYTKLYYRINKRECAIRHTMGQSVFRIHKELLIYSSISVCSLVVLTNTLYKREELKIMISIGIMMIILGLVLVSVKITHSRKYK